MKTTAKKCKGTGKAKGYGCGTATVFRKYGLCNKCLSNWMQETKEGKEFLSKLSLRGKRKTANTKRAERREEKKAAKTIGKLKSELQKEVNTIVRLMDADKGCVSCNHGHNTPFTRQAHAGHYHSVGSSNSIRYHLDNIHKQCSICNNYRSGALREYKQGLIKRYGEDYAEIVEGLKVKYPYIKLSRQEYGKALKIARKIIREIKQGRDYTRNEVNQLLEIYK